jgi:acid phosphatase class B
VSEERIRTLAHIRGYERVRLDMVKRTLGSGMRVAGSAVLLAGVLAGCATTPEPANLTPHKQEIRAYIESGTYLRQVEAVATRAKQWIEERASRGGARLTVVFDLDETLLFNWPHIGAMDFGYVESAWDRWVEEANAPAIEPVREVYRTARRLGLEVVFLTGRRESQRESTVRNLRAIECGDFAVLICKASNDRTSAAQYKTAARQRLVEEGRTIVANLGDQESDLAGGYAERVFKLPNAIYRIE